MTKVYKRLASLIEARSNCIQSGNTEWRDKHEERAEQITKNHLPSGSGFDAGTTLDLGASTAERLVFRTSFHHMNGDGYYDGWSDHTVIVTPSLAFDYTLRITGRDRDDWKEYARECFSACLDSETDL
jgi:hypothetical protein